MKKMFWAFVFLTVVHDGFGAGEMSVSGGKSAGMGYTGVTGTGLWAVCNNPSGMAFAKGLQVGVFAESRFLLSDLTSGSLALTSGGKYGAVGLYADFFGNQLYRESKVVTGYARKFGNHFSAGIVFDYLHISQPADYGDLDIVSFEAGLMCRPDNKWAIGIHVVNPIPIYLSKDKTEKLPIVFRTGFSRSFSGKAELAAEIEKSLSGKPVIRAGLEYHLHKRFSLRTGFASEPQTVTAGAGMLFGRLRLDLAASWQPVLGYSPQIGVEWKINER